MLFVDSTEPSEVERIFAWGVVRGVTTNPLIFARESGAADLESRIRQILAVSTGPVSVELTSTDEAGMLGEAERYRAWDPARVCIKVPFSEIGLRVTHQLRARGALTNVTCMMSFNQAYLAAQTGSDFISIFSGRVRDTGYDVRPTIRELRAQLDRESLASQIIVGSIRHAMDVTDALQHGAHVVTASPDILRRMLHHPKTDEAIAEFNDAWKKRGG
jgi:transaldolase